MDCLFKRQCVTRGDARHSTAAPQRNKRSIGALSAFWPNGSTLRIAFIDDDLAPDHKQQLIDAINAWQPYVNLRFEFIDGREGQPDHGKGDIRITTDSSMNYSLIGTAAKANDPWDPTMVLGVQPSDPKFAGTVMHEFGHALGAEHEHQHPEADIPWDVPKVYAFYESKGHSRETVDENVLGKLSAEATLMLPYDRDSIMHYPVDNALTLGDWEVSHNAILSEKDKAFMQAAYPKECLVRPDDCLATTNGAQHIVVRSKATMSQRDVAPKCHIPGLP